MNPYEKIYRLIGEEIRARTGDRLWFWLEAHTEDPWKKEATPEDLERLVCDDH